MSKLLDTGWHFKRRITIHNKNNSIAATRTRKISIKFKNGQINRRFNSTE